MKKVVVTIALLLSISALASESYKVRREPLLGYIHDRQGVTFQVFSGGCTDKSDFLVYFETQNGQLAMNLYRNRPDNCRAYYPYGIYLHYTYAELRLNKGQRFQISNPIVSSRRGGF